jgi:RHH-type proline utilization regulon transcriptional repressor/proline dehydrogenase/delta 1-pyrroline-5-carboxylate dehydrogenase
MALFSRKAPVKASVVASTPIAIGSAVEDSRIEAIGRELLDRARGHKTGLLSREFYSNALMEWSMKDPSFKVQMFRFVDCFPMLKDSDQVYEHLKDYLAQPGVSVPPVIATALKAGSLAKGLAARTISSQIEGMAGKFIAGRDAASALDGLKKLWKDGIAFSVDLLGEACVSDAEAVEYQHKYLDLIQNLPGAVAAWNANEALERDHLGGIPRVNVSIKVSSLSARCDPIDTEGSIRDLMSRIEPVLETARDRGVFINFDMEQFAFKDLTIELFQRCCERIDFHAGLAMQAYLRSGEDDARRVSEWAKRTGRVATVRLVKGAYWDYETIKAEQMGWPSPVWAKKHETDACFERMTAIYLDAAVNAGAEASRRQGTEGESALGPTRVAPGKGGIKLALGSHNARSIAAALAGLEAKGLPRNSIELQMLHGMADQLKSAASEMGLRVREYVPVGEMIPGMAYLVRRLLENTSNESWLRAGFLDNADPAVLLANPARGGVQTSHNGIANGIHAATALLDPARHALSPAVKGVGDGKAFFNESMRDFSRASVRDQFAGAIGKASVPRVANDTSREQVDSLIARATKAFPAWRDFDPIARCGVLIEAARSMRARRDELSGVMIKESGKTWREADADACEAIDFCEYYARVAAPMFARERLGRFIGELDEQWHQARGVAAVIAPWNFPLAICTGMTVAALVTGNTVIVKPAEQTPGIARIMADLLNDALRKAGAPEGVLQFAPGAGEVVGASLVRDPRVALIAFTGSRDVGLDILNAAAPMSAFGADRAAYEAFVRGEHAQVKKVICEMGGKNAVIIDTSADLDEAVLGVRHSAFGFQGQKCSAASRVIVVDPAGSQGPAITTFVRRFVEATKALTIGDPMLPGTDVGPVIDAESKAKIQKYIELGKRESRLELAMATPAGLEEKTGRHFVGPHVFSGVKPEHAIWRDEIFGPVIAVMHASSYDEALALANASPYKLTGGVFSRKPSHLEQAKREFRVGNLYLNRGITGALVARQPFGGFGMSGVGSKAGGRDYLLQFVEPRASSENTLRRGFAPEL